MKKRYFYLEPYVHVSRKKDDVLIYNPLNGSVLDYRRKPEISKVLKRLTSKRNLFVIELLTRDMANPVIRSFIKEARQLFMGDLLEDNGSNRKPVQVIPGVKILQEFSPAPNEEIGIVGIDLMSNIHELSFYINNNDESRFCRTGVFKNAYKQFLSPWWGGDKKEELPFPLIKKAFSDAENSSLFRINILGEDIFSYSQFKSLTEHLNENNVIKSYYTHYKSLLDKEEQLKLIHGPEPASGNKEYKWELNVFVDFPVEKEEFVIARRIAAQSGIHAKFHMVIRNEREFGQAETLISRFQLEDYQFQPYFTGRNLGFFKEQVFLSREEIFEGQPSQRDILSREMINQVNFGKLTVLSNGNVHANVNLPSLGNIGEDSLNTIVLKEMHQKKSWFRNRSTLKPCKGCTLQYLCPSPSNYEFVIGKNDLCNVSGIN